MSHSEGEGQLTCALCSQVIDIENECGYVESTHDTCNLNHHHRCLMRVQERSFRDEIAVKCYKCTRRVLNVYDSEKNITYGPNEETDVCAICQNQLNTRFALGNFGCGHCEYKFHWICLVGWAKKAREFRDHCDVSNVLVHYKPDQETHRCCQCKRWGMLQRRKHGE